MPDSPLHSTTTLTPAPAILPHPTAIANPLLSVRDIHIAFAQRRGFFASASPAPIVKGVSFDLSPSSVLALVGESGCGKTTIARAILGLLPPTASVQGVIEFEGVNLLTRSTAQLRPVRQRLQVVFQDPGGSMNPGMTIADIVGEPLAIHEPRLSRKDRLERTTQSLQRCGISSAFLQRLPSQLSGGQRQRVCIARALITNPTLLICDEPTSALDVSVQAQILNLLADLRRDLGLACLFITHDMGVVRQLADHLGVMHAGSIVESGPAESILDAPQHPYSRQLLDAVPGRGLGRELGQGLTAR